MSPNQEDPSLAAKLELYRALVQTNPEVELKGASHPYTSLNGHMFSYLHPSGSLALRLGEKELTRENSHAKLHPWSAASLPPPPSLRRDR